MPAGKAALSSSLEDYLEAILAIWEQQKAVRAKDIAGRLAVKNSSVTTALKALASRALIDYSPYGIIALTPAGEKAARTIKEKHSVVREFLLRVLKLDFEDAEQVACQLEHAIPNHVSLRWRAFMSRLAACPLAKNSPRVGKSARTGALKNEKTCPLLDEEL